MKPVFATLVSMIEAHGAAALVTVIAVQGSSPREAGARLMVRPDGGYSGTIGGGTLEWKALAEAQSALTGRDRTPFATRSYALGPELGQCCGGRVELAYEVFSPDQAPALRALAALEAAGPVFTVGRIDATGRLVRTLDADPPPAVSKDAQSSAWWGKDGVLRERFGADPRTIVLFGAGHVGRALVLALAPLPFKVLWVDPRPDAFPGMTFFNAVAKQLTVPHSVLSDAPEGAFVLVMTHSHSLDLDCVHAALSAGRFPYVGLIGSATKRARFRKRLAELGHAPDRIDALHCPIGIEGIRSKQPAVIAAATAADLILRDEALRSGRSVPDAAREIA
jgi:xanthine dehydrogenase accessory factor